MKTSRRTIRRAAAVCGLLLMSALAAQAADTQAPASPPAGQPASGAQQGPTLDPKKIFAANCSWCHRAYGMEAGAGPRLAGTAMTEDEVKQRIHNGKPGYMPPFKDALTDEQIAVMAHYIKSLKVPE